MAAAEEKQLCSYSVSDLSEELPNRGMDFNSRGPEMVDIHQLTLLAARPSSACFFLLMR